MDAEVFKLVNTLLGALASLLCGYLLIVIKSRRAEEKQFRENMGQQIEELRTQTTKQLQEFVAQNNLQVSVLREQLDNEVSRLQHKDNTIGRDIQTTRAAFAYVCGKIGQDFPQYPTNGH